MKQAFRIALLLSLISPAFGQINALRPDVVQSFTSPYAVGGTTALAFTNSVTSGNLLLGCASWQGTGLTLSSPTDTLGTSYTLTTQLNVTGPTTAVSLVCWYGVAPSGGADTVSVNGINAAHRAMNIAEFQNISGTLDVTATGSASASFTAMTASPTTTVNGDLIITGAADGCVSIPLFANYPHQFASGNTSETDNLVDFYNTNIAGTYSLTVQAVNVGGSGSNCDSGAMIALAFKPSAMAITTTVLPDGAQTSAYKACLTSVGGAGAVTWSATSGLPAWATVSSTPSGCPLNATGEITGTPNASATSTIALQVTDGTRTATKTLTIKTGASFASPTLVQSGHGGSSVTLPSQVHIGDLLIVTIWGPEIGGSHNWIMPVNGNLDGFVDSIGTSFFRVHPVTTMEGSSNGAPTFVVAGIARTCSASSYTVGYIDNSGIGGAPAMLVEDWSGVQGVIDEGTNAMAKTLSGAVNVTSGNYSAQVANEILHASSTTANISSSLTFGAPFSTIFSGQTGNFSLVLGSADDSPGAAGSYTASSSASLGAAISIQLIGLRPGLAAAACVPPVLEKYKRQVW